MIVRNLGTLDPQNPNDGLCRDSGATTRHARRVVLTDDSSGAVAIRRAAYAASAPRPRASSSPPPPPPIALLTPPAPHSAVHHRRHPTPMSATAGVVPSVRPNVPIEPVGRSKISRRTGAYRGDSRRVSRATAQRPSLARTRARRHSGRRAPPAPAACRATPPDAGPARSLAPPIARPAADAAAPRGSARRRRIAPKPRCSHACGCRLHRSRSPQRVTVNTATSVTTRAGRRARKTLAASRTERASLRSMLRSRAIRSAQRPLVARADRDVRL